MSTYKKKLIEVALPLEAINAESVKQKTGRPPAGYPTSLHKYWAQRSIASARAAIWSSLIDDPSAQPDLYPTVESQTKARAALFLQLENVLSWESSQNAGAWNKALTTLNSSLPDGIPPFLDPFAGSGAIALEAQRFGMEAHASDLNPLAVTLEKAALEWPARFSGMPSIAPQDGTHLQHTSALSGLADDILYYANQVNTELLKQLRHHYPTIIGADNIELQPGTYLWARTVVCPNQLCAARTPLVLDWKLRAGKSAPVSIKPIVDAANKTVSFRVVSGPPRRPPTFSGKNGGTCLFCDSPINIAYVRANSSASVEHDRLLAICAGVDYRWIFCDATLEEELRAKNVPIAKWSPRGEVPNTPKIAGPAYGMKTWASMFTPRQLLALTLLHDTIESVQKIIQVDASKHQEFAVDQRSLAHGGAGAKAYSEVIRSYLHLVGTNLVDTCSKYATWAPGTPSLRNAFVRQAIGMNWGYAEASLFGKSNANFIEKAKRMSEVVEHLPSGVLGEATQQDASKRIWTQPNKPLVITDPPYFDLIEFGELSDFFYVWMREVMRDLNPDLYATLLTPKEDELSASPHRFGGDKLKGKQEFESGLTEAMTRLREIANPDYPLSIYYAYNDRETTEDESGQMVTSSSGWETMLQSLVNAGLTVVATYPFRTEAKGRANSNGTNALAAAILVVCRIRSDSSKIGTRAEFVLGLSHVMAPALRDLVAANIGPIDLAQAAIGPGMSVYTSFSKVLEANGNQMSMGTALDLIHQAVKEAQGSQDATFDAETRWAIEWFSTYRYTEGEYGDAQVLANSAGITMQGLAEAGVVKAAGGKVALSAGDGLPDDWDPSTDTRVTSWEVLHHLMRALLPEEMGPAAKSGGGSEAEAVKIAEKLSPALMQNAKLLAYRLFEICREQSWDKEGMAFNNFGRSWGEIQSAERKTPGDQQGLWEGDSK